MGFFFLVQIKPNEEKEEEMQSWQPKRNKKKYVYENIYRVGKIDAGGCRAIDKKDTHEQVREPVTFKHDIIDHEQVDNLHMTTHYRAVKLSLLLPPPTSSSVTSSKVFVSPRKTDGYQHWGPFHVSLMFPMTRRTRQENNNKIEFKNKKEKQKKKKKKKRGYDVQSDWRPPRPLGMFLLPGHVTGGGGGPVSASDLSPPSFPVSVSS